MSVIVSAPSSRALRTIPQAMAQLSCSRGMIYKLGKEKKLELVKFGGHTRVTERSLNALVDEILTGDSIQPLPHEPHKSRDDEN